MLSLYMFYESARGGGGSIVQPQKPSNKVTPGNTFSAAEAQNIIDSNRQKPQTKAVVNINPKSATDVLSNSSNSASQASSNYSNNSLNAGQRSSSLTSSYISRPQRTPSRVGINPTFSASSI